MVHHASEAPSCAGEDDGALLSQDRDRGKDCHRCEILHGDPFHQSSGHRH